MFYKIRLNQGGNLSDLPDPNIPVAHLISVILKDDAARTVRRHRIFRDTDIFSRAPQGDTILHYYPIL